MLRWPRDSHRLRTWKCGSLGLQQTKGPEDRLILTLQPALLGDMLEAVRGWPSPCSAVRGRFRSAPPLDGGWG